jgi:hypothetical protein
MDVLNDGLTSLQWQLNLAVVKYFPFADA